jgi:integrase/recombinase XerD
LNWGSFRYNRKGYLFADIIGKGSKPRSIPIREETKEILFNYRKAIGEGVEINIENTGTLFFALYNKREAF